MCNIWVHKGNMTQHSALVGSLNENYFYLGPLHTIISFNGQKQNHSISSDVNII